MSNYLERKVSLDTLSTVGPVGSLRPPMPPRGKLPGSSREPYAGWQTKRLPLPVSLFLFSLILPWIISVGPLNLSVYRIVLLIMMIPCLVGWMRGQAGRIRAEDGFILLYCLWGIASLINAHGFGGALEPGGILFVETIGAYLLARCYIRDADGFRAMARLLVILVFLLLPFAVYEWITGNKPLLSLLGEILPTVEVTKMEPRLGFWRVQGPFSHSILFGAICSSTLALTYMVVGKAPLQQFLLASAVFFAAATSMSSAPMASLALQIFLIAWNGAFRAYTIRWKLLLSIVLLGYFFIEFGSNQGAIKFYISYFTFDKETGWFRILIWDYGSASVLNHPLLGVGLGYWVRPIWMPESVDNFWLLTGMRHGLPALGLLVGACALIVAGVARNGIDESLQRYRTAYLICLITYFIVGTTVHFWTASYVWFLFILGSGAWFSDPRPAHGVVIGRPGQTVTPAARQGARRHCPETRPQSKRANFQAQEKEPSTQQTVRRHSSGDVIGQVDHRKGK